MRPGLPVRGAARKLGGGWLTTGAGRYGTARAVDPGPSSPWMPFRRMASSCLEPLIDSCLEEPWSLLLWARSKQLGSRFFTREQGRRKH